MRTWPTSLVMIHEVDFTKVGHPHSWYFNVIGEATELDKTLAALFLRIFSAGWTRS